MKKTKQIIFFIVLLILVALNILPKEINDMDEIWNYNFANCIAQGLVPYKDFNIVQTPLLPIISGLILKLTINQLLVMRILAIILSGSILFLIYKILDSLKIDKNINLLTIIILFCLLKNYLCIDYNFFALFLTLLIMYIELKNKKDSALNNLFIGILGGLVILTKQSIGLFVCISIIGYRLIFLFKNKENKKEKIKKILLRIIGISTPVIVFIIYLLMNHSVNEFIDYAILGLATFTNKMSYLTLITKGDLVIKIMAIIVPVLLITELVYSIKKHDEKMFIVTLLSLSMFVVVFPISDVIHFLIGSTTSLIGLVYMLNNFFREKGINLDSSLKIYVYIMIFALIIVEGFGFYSKYKKIETYSNLNHFKYIPISSNLEEYIHIIDEYIVNNKTNVYILNHDAALFMIPINRYNKNYDMFLIGNLGKDGEEGQIEKIKNEDAIYMIKTDEIPMNWQNPEKVRNYIKNNLEKFGEGYDFYFYKNK